jgi:sodium/bile acid cotransporter 7
MSVEGNEKEIPEVSLSSDADEPPESLQSKLWKQVVAFYFANEFMILAILAIIIAKAYPPLGANYLKPKITASWIAVIFIFCKFCPT